MSSKLIGAYVNFPLPHNYIYIFYRDADFFAELCVEAAQLVKVTDSTHKVTYPISAINILKSHGKSARETQLVRGYALNCTRASDGRPSPLCFHKYPYFIAMPRKIMNPKIACLDFSLQKSKMHLGISVVVEDPTKLEAIRRE